MAVVLGCIQHTAFEEFSLRHVGTEKNCTAKIELKKMHIVFLVERKKKAPVRGLQTLAFGIFR